MNRIRVFDIGAILISISVLGAFSYHVYADRGGEAVVYIQNQSKVWIYPLSKEQELDIPGPLGSTHIHIKDGAAFVENSPCRDKICIHMGRIARNGEWVACLPNRVFLQVQGKTGNNGPGEEVDASTF
ncbi:MAG: NusG domain II-containing protein [Spirochaetes bacterium]|nr:NusG domain II-containing protein [Spirochaetota bacterium]